MTLEEAVTQAEHDLAVIATDLGADLPLDEATALAVQFYTRLGERIVQIVDAVQAPVRRAP
jgi:hypothetical protein